MLERPIISEREAAVQALRDYIREGGYHPGDRLPPERELMTRLEMGRTLLRRGLEVLEREGAIWRHVGKGTFVANDPIAGSLSELSKRVSPINMMRARLSLEPAIAREAAINATEDKLVPLRVALERSENAPNWDEYEAQDDIFHRAVAEATGNALLLALFDQLNQVRRAIAWNTVQRQTVRPPRDHSSFAEHREVLGAIESHDPERAHQGMRGHLGSVSNRLFGEF